MGLTACVSIDLCLIKITYLTQRVALIMLESFFSQLLPGPWTLIQGVYIYIYILLMKGTLHQLMLFCMFLFFLVGFQVWVACFPMGRSSWISDSWLFQAQLPNLLNLFRHFIPGWCEYSLPHLLEQKLYIASLDMSWRHHFEWKQHESISFWMISSAPVKIHTGCRFFCHVRVCAILITIGFRSNYNERHEGSINSSEMLQIKRPTGKFGGCRNQTRKKISQNSPKNRWIISSSIWKELIENSKASENSNPRCSSNAWPSIWLIDFNTMAFCCCPSLSGGFGGNSPNLMGITFLRTVQLLSCWWALWHMTRSQLLIFAQVVKDHRHSTMSVFYF